MRVCLLTGGCGASGCVWPAMDWLAVIHRWIFTTSRCCFQNTSSGSVWCRMMRLTCTDLNSRLLMTHSRVCCLSWHSMRSTLERLSHPGTSPPADDLICISRTLTNTLLMALSEHLFCERVTSVGKFSGNLIFPEISGNVSKRLEVITSRKLNLKELSTVVYYIGTHTFKQLR